MTTKALAAALPRKKWLSRDEAAKLLEAARGEGEGNVSVPSGSWMLLFLILNTGLRVSEAVALRWEDIGDGRLRVRTAKQGAAVVDEIPVAAGVLTVLEKERKRRGAKTTDSLFGFGVRRAQTIFDRAASRAGLKQRGRGIHCLRHTFALIATEASGGNPVEVAGLLRHRHLSSTQVYLHTARLKEVRQKMGVIS